MSPLEAVKILEAGSYYDEDGGSYSVELFPAMTEAELSHFAASMPEGILQPEMEEMLRYTSGITHPYLDIFDLRIPANQYDNPFFPGSIHLGNDGAGNQWLLDVTATGDDWGAVYFLDHDPPVVMRFADSLADFFLLLDQLGRNPEESAFERLLGDVDSSIYRAGLDPQPTGDLGYDLSEIDALPALYRVESLEKGGKQGFVWALHRGYGFVYKFPDRPVWVVEVKEAKDMLGRKKPGIPAPRRRSLLERLLDKFSQ